MRTKTQEYVSSFNDTRHKDLEGPDLVRAIHIHIANAFELIEEIAIEDQKK